LIPSLRIEGPAGRPLRLLALGAHPDDIEIGAAGLVARLVAESPGVCVRWLIATGGEPRATEARTVAATLLAGAGKVEVNLGGLRDGHLPFLGSAPKDWLAGHAGFAPDVVLSPWRGDAHQDHRLLGELAWQVFRDALVLEYEIAKFDGDLGRPNVYVALDEAAAERKVRLILDGFPSQRDRRWFNEETFLALLRLRGLEAGATAGYAEAFHAAKLVIANPAR
jgi:LmbE family N-acetylglucosaminyl deacetylase